MGDTSAIAWTDATWNPVLGCAKVSPGCENCYAMVLAHKLGLPREKGGFGQKAYEGLTYVRPDGSVNWTGEVRFLPERLALPLKWTRPRRIFVNSMSDLFHPAVGWSRVVLTFALMSLAHQHIFQVLTKRPERMASLLGAPGFRQDVESERINLATLYLMKPHRPLVLPPFVWPIPNVWLGTSTEDQTRADERIPPLLATPAAIRFLSCEPLLGPIELSDVTNRSDASARLGRNALEGIHWIIVGGESGKRFRPMDPSWARSLREQCAAAGVAFFYKQSAGPRAGTGRELDGRLWEAFPATETVIPGVGFGRPTTHNPLAGITPSQSAKEVTVDG